MILALQIALLYKKTVTESGMAQYLLSFFLLFDVIYDIMSVNMSSAYPCITQYGHLWTILCNMWVLQGEARTSERHEVFFGCKHCYDKDYVTDTTKGANLYDTEKEIR